MTYDNAEDYLVRAQEAAYFFDNTGRREGIRQFIDEKSYKPDLGACDKTRVGATSVGPVVSVRVWGIRTKGWRVERATAEA